MGVHYVVVDSEATVRFAIRTGLPLEDLLEKVCTKCGQPVFLTRKQFDAFRRDPYIRSLNKPLAFAWRKCDEAKQDEAGG